VQGQREDVLEIVVDPSKLDAYNISYQEIASVVSANNRLVPAGQIDTGEGRFAIKIPGLIKTAEDALNLPVRSDAGAVVTVGDIADVRRTYKDRSTIARFNGEPALSIEIVKRNGANILETSAQVRGVLETESQTWPSSVQFAVTADESEMIGDQLGQLQGSILTAVVLVMIICVAALGFRSALLVGISIPSSFVMAFLMLGAFGYTINMMVMFGMVIAVGILVDGAIVVVEYADRKMAEGLNRQDAYAMAGKRMFWPVVASNATTLAAFVPFLFWNSMPGKFMAYLPITLIFVLSSSLVMALIFLPVLGSVIGARPKHAAGNTDLAALSGAEGNPDDVGGWLGKYVALTRALIRRPLLVSLAAIFVVVSIFVWFAKTPHKSEFFLDVEPEQVYVFVRAQGSLSAAEEYAIVARAEAAIQAVKGVESYALRTGNADQSPGDGANGIPSDSVGQILIDLLSNDGVHDGRQVVRDLRASLDEVPGLQYELKPREDGPPAGKDVEIALRSENLTDLYLATSMLRQKFSTMDGLRDIEDTRPLPGIEYQLKVNRAEAGKFGLDVSQIGAAVQLVTNGILVGRYRPDDANDEVDIRVRFPQSARSVEALDTLRIATPQGQVPLSLFVERVPAQRVSKIDRQNGLRVVTVRANTVEQGEGAAKVAELTEWLETVNLPSTVRVEFQGAAEDAAEASAFFGGAALAALFMMGIILLWEFNNFWQVVLTLSAVIISTSGVLLGIQLALPYISILMIGTGVVALAGIVVNNNIVLIDTFNRLLESGRSPEDAAVATAAQRIRPILLTTATTICGLLPMVMMMNVDFGAGAISFGGVTAEWWVQLATAVVFGLGFSTIMILLVTPVWLTVPHKIGTWTNRMIQRVKTGKSEAESAAQPAAE
jgi:multidrug efflux pump